MQQKASKILAISGLLVLLAAAVPAFAHPPGSDMPPPPPPHPRHGPPPPGPPHDPVIGMAGGALHAVEMDANQRRRVHDVVRGYVEGELGERLRELHEAKRALEIAIWDPAASEEDIRGASETVAGLARRLEQARHRLALDVLQVLTEGQRETFRRMLETEPRHGPGPHGS